MNGEKLRECLALESVEICFVTYYFKAALNMNSPVSNYYWRHCTMGQILILYLAIKIKLCNNI